MALMNSKLATALLAGTLILGASNAFAETVLRRGNSGEPKSLDYAHISINIEGFVIYDLFEGLVIHNAKGEIGTGRGRKLEGLRRRYRLHLQDPR